MSFEISFNSLAKGREGSINWLCSGPEQGPLTWPNRSSSKLLSCCCCGASLCDSINLHVMKDCTHYVKQSRGKASRGQKAFASWNTRKEMIFLLVIHGIFLCITFIYSVAPASFSLFGLQLLMQNHMHTPSGVLSHDKNHKAFWNVPFHMLHILAAASAAMRRFSAST